MELSAIKQYVIAVIVTIVCFAAVRGGIKYAAVQATIEANAQARQELTVYGFESAADSYKDQQQMNADYWLNQ